MSPRYVLPVALLFVLLISAFGVWYYFFHLGKNAFPNYVMTEYQVTLKETPYSIGRGAASRYQFHSNEYPNAFWLARGAFDLIHDNKILRTAVLSLKAGDTVMLLVREDAINILGNPYEEVYVKGLSFKGRQWISPEKMHQQYLWSEGVNYLFGLGFAAFVVLYYGLMIIKKG